MWINVKDKLPDDDQIVLACVESSINDKDPFSTLDVVRFKYVDVDDENAEPNNECNYEWCTIGGFDTYFGQDVYYWMIPPTLPDDIIEKHKEEFNNHAFNDDFIDSCKIIVNGLLENIK